MCGIIGYACPPARDESLSSALGAGIDSLAHRGPDDRGRWSHTEDSVAVGFGHTRLSILDLSDTGHQPMLSASGRYAITYNGEIYNFSEVRADLESCGVRFRSTGDTEVILEAFERWGLAAVDRFIGMFAFALWDRAERRVLLVRDRVGVKPLYFCLHDRAFAFASELRGLYAFDFWPRDIDGSSLSEFLQFGYIAAPWTIFKTVHSLEPGAWVSYSPSEGLRSGTYWSLGRSSSANDIPDDEPTAKERLRELLEAACRYRLVSDVPVGVFLSGGIDSSLVAAIIAKRLGADTRTFTIGFNEASYDESGWAAAVARHLGTRHIEQKLSIDEAERTVESWGELFDEPFGDSSAIPTLLVSRVAREHVKVALSADGGDELFGGYVNYTAIPPKIRTLRAMPRPVRRMLGGALRTRGGTALAAQVLRQPLEMGEDKTLDRIRKLAEAFSGSEAEAVFQLAISYSTPEQVAELVPQLAHARPSIGRFRGSLEEAMMSWDFHHYLPGDILVKVDRMTMHVSLEGREPLLDHRLIEFAFASPLRYRIGAMGTKHLLRSILYDLVPRELLERPKQGFGIPLGAWMRKGRLHAMVRELLSTDSLAGSGLVDPAALSRIVDGFLAGARIDHKRVWLLLALEMWRRKWHSA